VKSVGKLQVRMQKQMDLEIKCRLMTCDRQMQQRRLLEISLADCATKE